MLKLLAPIGILLALAGCTPAASPTANARANERAAVAAAESAYVLVATGCLDYVQETKDAKVAAVCQAALDPAHDLIIEASLAVDATWTPSAACNLVQGAQLLTTAVAALGTVGATLQAAAGDALVVANALAGVACAADAGGQ